MDEDGMGEIVSVGGAARILGCSEATVRAWTSTGKLKAFRLQGTGQRLYLRDQIERVARERGDR